MPARVTVGLPVYNGAATIDQALAALVAQTYPHLDIVVADNASDDATPEIVGRFAAAHSNVRVIRHEHNIGMLPNFEFVVAAAADTDFFMWAAADDQWSPGFISTLVDVLQENPEAGVAMSSVQTVDPGGREVDRVCFSRWNSLNRKPRWWAAAQMMNLLPGPPTHWYIYGVWRKSVLDGLMARPFPRGRAGDRVLMCEATFATNLVDTPEVLYVRTVRGEGLDTRYADDALGVAWRDPRAERGYLLTLLRRLVTSPRISLLRKAGLALPFWTVLAVKRRAALFGRAGAS